ncbi:beta strand repeat-containing protein [Arsenicibacter rosenii]|uniref:Ig-like domain-containing protein n=1 Tax=Arsenicibacter rosenii TaxID=1750698 RepID=A0A1S2VMA4_9BACT|nr:immunoglobulin domain-containing protein [Arsenicibacter rosenii]OIN59893.1 hypothetical protein BLX24_08585 [Arsenicibacter rosenii]
MRNTNATPLSLTITPSQASYTEGQSVTVTFSGATVGDNYNLALYDNSNDYNKFDNDVDIQANTTGSNTILGWVSTQDSYFVVRFKSGSAASARILGIINTNAGKSNDYGDSQSFAIVAPVSTPVFCNTIAYVTPTGAGANDGSSWANALPGAQLAQALSTACANTTFLVGSGLYKPTTGTDQTASFTVASGVQVYGGYVVSGNTATRETFVVGTPGSTTFSGDIGTSASTDNSYQVIQIVGTTAGTRLDGIVITAGCSNALNSGGGIYSTGASYTLANATLTDNAANQGGAVFMQGGNLFVTGTSITRNTANMDGGALYFTDAATFVVDNSSLSDNRSSNSNGGAVYTAGSLTVSVTSSTIGQNSAPYDGGAFRVNGSVVLAMTGSKVFGNASVSSNGGVFKISGGLTATITSSSISQNTSNVNGACFDVSNAVNLTLTNSAFIRNIARNSNGGVVNSSAGLTAVITSCSVSQNSASYGGGVGNLSGAVSLTVTDSDLSGNNCTNSNGGVINTSSPIHAVINNTHIRQNVARNTGGVFNTNGSMNLMLSNSDLSQNIASNSNGGVVYAGSLTAVVTSCTVSQNSANSSGGALYSQGVTALTLTNGDIRNNSSSNSNGGFLYAQSSLNVWMDGVRMEQNKANNSGGAVYSSGFGTLSAKNSVFNQNQVILSGNGGVFYFSSGIDATITSSSVTQNSAPNSGAALYGGYGGTSHFAIDNSLFSQNLVSQGGNGGVLYVSSTLAATITSTTMSQNTSPSGGAAIAASSGSTTFVTDNSYFTGNIVTQGGTGGALYLNGGITSIKNSVFTGNRSPNPGGAIYVGSPTALTVANTLIQQNSVGQGGPGGGMMLNGATGSITSTTMSQNTAANGGGGLYVSSSGSLTLANSLISQNVSPASDGGGLYTTGGITTHLTNVTISQNSAPQGLGGGAYVSTNGQMTNCVITQNSALSGGGIVSEGNEFTLVNNLFTGNAASESGGAMLTDAAITVVNQTISGNSAPTGSAVSVLGGGVLDLKNSIVWNNATPANSFSVDGTASLSLTNSISDPAATGFGSGGNNKTGDPLFMNAATGDFTLKGCSPAINAGVDAVNTTTTDLAGLNRKASTIDMGAYEFQGTPVSLTLTATASKTLACTGEILPLTASLSGGTSPYSYSWTTTDTGVTLPSSATGSPLSVTLTGAGQKSFTVTGQDAGGCTATPVVVSVSVVNGVSITAQPVASSAVCVGVAVSVPVSVTGDVISQQWYKNGSPVASQTATTLSLTATTADAGSYQLIIQTSGCGSLTSSAFSLTVSEVVAISSQPAGASAVCVGAPVSVPVSVTGAGATYQWYKGGSPVGGQTTATLSIPSPTVADAGSYSLVVTGGCNSVTSSAFSLTVHAAPVVTITPSTTTIAGGQSATLTASGANSYIWSNSSSQTAISVSPTQTTVYSVTGTSNGCIGTATTTVSVTCNSSVVADAVSMTQNLVLGGSNCAVTLQGYGFGNAFTVTGPDGYVFSTVYRRPGLYTVNALNVKQPGTYTMNTSYTDACGRVTNDTVTYVVTGEACK